MVATYASFLLVLVASALVGQACFAAAGARRWSRLAPAVGLAALLALAWGAARLPGEGTTALIACALACALAIAYLRRRITGTLESLRRGAATEIGALALASIPFIVEMRFGILGTGLNPDMSQHLFAADRLAAGGSERLIAEGYPLGPHSLVVAVSALGPSLVHGFDGLTAAVAAMTCFAALGALERDELAAWKRVAGALVVGFAYLLASNYIQGAFKESIQALFVLAFALALGELARHWPERERAPRALRALPLAVLALGSVYAYSFPGLAWLAGTLGVWAAIELTRAARRGGLSQALRLARLVAPTALVALAVLTAAVAPEIGRIAEFAKFETFDPDGAGLGNLFDRLSPLEALGIWPSGEFRVEPGDGSVPALVFYLGAALAGAALAYGIAAALRRGERALLAGLAAATALWLYTLVAGTPYQEAKALVLIAPLVLLVSVRALLADGPPLAALAFIAAAGGSALLALANGPVGPSGYSPALAELRGELGPNSVTVLAPPELLADQHGRDYLVWELRGNRICVEESGGEAIPAMSQLLVALDDGAVVPGGLYRNRSGALAGDEPCPFIADGARADPAGDD